MRLADLDPGFIRWEDCELTRNRTAPGFDTRTEEGMRQWTAAGSPTVPHTGPATHMIEVQSLEDSQGIEFDCPKCRSPGHRIHIAFANRGVLDHQATRASDGRPTRWQVVGGTGFDDLSLSPSIDCTSSNPNCWHGFVTAGEAT